MWESTRGEDQLGDVPATWDELPSGRNRALSLVKFWPLVAFFLSIPFAFLSDRFGWPSEVEHGIRLLELPALALIAGAIGLQRFLKTTQGKPDARKRAIAEYLGVPGDETEPEASRRLWQWQCVLYALLVPGVYFLVILPVVSFASMASFGSGTTIDREVGGGRPEDRPTDWASCRSSPIWGSC